MYLSSYVGTTYCLIEYDVQLNTFITRYSGSTSGTYASVLYCDDTYVWCVYSVDGTMATYKTRKCLVSDFSVVQEAAATGGWNAGNNISNNAGYSALKFLVESTGILHIPKSTSGNQDSTIAYINLNTLVTTSSNRPAYGADNARRYGDGFYTDGVYNYEIVIPYNGTYTSAVLMKYLPGSPTSTLVSTISSISAFIDYTKFSSIFPIGSKIEDIQFSDYNNEEVWLKLISRSGTYSYVYRYTLVCVDSLFTKVKDCITVGNCTAGSDFTVGYPGGSAMTKRSIELNKQRHNVFDKLMFIDTEVNYMKTVIK